jgi:SNF2 family DNA or RNA helicase
MKSLIAHQLPKKTDRVVFCSLTKIQKAAYERFLDSDVVEIVKYSTEMCDCNSGKARGWCCYITLEGTNTPWKV